MTKMVQAVMAATSRRRREIPDDPALRGDPVGARVGRRDASDGAR